jgi:hypothetical protein
MTKNKNQSNDDLTADKDFQKEQTESTSSLSAASEKPKKEPTSQKPRSESVSPQPKEKKPPGLTLLNRWL